MAARKGDIALVQQLLDAGANPILPNVRGRKINADIRELIDNARERKERAAQTLFKASKPVETTPLSESVSPTLGHGTDKIHQ